MKGVVLFPHHDYNVRGKTVVLKYRIDRDTGFEWEKSFQCSKFVLLVKILKIFLSKENLS